MKKAVTIFKTSVKALENREDYYQVYLKAGSGVIDCVMERSTIRNIVGIWDNGIGTGFVEPVELEESKKVEASKTIEE